MSKNLKSILSIGLAIVLTLSIPIFAMASENVGRIVRYEINDTEAFAFIPDGIVARRGAGRGNATAVQQIAPIIIVYGDEPFTAETAMQTAVSSGLADIARAEGAVISFVNPKTDGTWSADDVATYRSIVQTKYIERPQNQNVPVDGIYPSATVPGGQFAGYFFRTYIIAAGSGADFAVSFLMDDTLVESRNIQAMPASYMLFGVSAVPGPNAGTRNQEHPALVINGSAEAQSAIMALNSRSNFVEIVQSSAPDFDKTILTNGYRELTGTMVRPQLAWSPLPNWSIALFQMANYLQIEEQSHAFGYTSKDVTGGTAFYDYFIPKSIDINAPESAPLILVFHGSGESSSYIANVGGWTKLGLEEGIMTVSVDNHGTPAVLNALLDELLVEYPFIDPARIYATGYSMGAMKTWSLIGATDRAERIAGVAPWNGLTVGAADQRTTIVPTIYMTGRDDTTTRLPGVGTAAQTAGPRNAMGFLFERQQIGTYVFDADDNPWWGVSGHKVEIIPAKSWTGEINIHTYESRLGNGMIYTKLVDGTNFGHSIVGDYAPLAWDFLKQFSRNADGSISVEPVSSTRFAGTSPNQLNPLLAQGNVTLATLGSGGYGIASGATLVVPEGRTLFVETILNVRRDATLRIEGTVVVLEGGRLNSDGHATPTAATGTIIIAEGGKLINEGYVEIAMRSTLTNEGTIINNGTTGSLGRFEVRAGTEFTRGLVFGTRALTIHREANIK